MKKIRPVTIEMDGVDMITPTGMFLLAANTIFTTEYEAAPHQVQNARSLMNGILAAAQKAGCRQTGKLRRLVKSDRMSGLALTMAQRACDAIPAPVMNDLLLRAHEAAASGASLCSQHGAYGAFVGAGDRVVWVTPQGVAEPPVVTSQG
ncbi:hypothetical protein HUX88_29030 [Duganella sp. BJB1802]|uniref:hypothetical protein n=1 Tax=Duganella sp. BJB1802 TaxID=2744575 RepID=UPI001594775B|nr:hypothetical protein [Duganella sp. BJB1802]NVD74532.1 hypothetical protein [Duganella sp. BJB1802]